ncbi:MAG: hypothetical protein HYV29_14450 [Ignavibacteriales bacterium]|nr:hypothetical protein [Ignavibacteriales bacterium]
MKSRLKNPILLLVVFFPLLLTAQQRPIAVESATLLESGDGQIEFGTAHFRDQPFPLSGLTGNLTKIGTLRFTIALSEYVELQTDGTLLDVLSVTDRVAAFNSVRTTTRNPTADVGDFSIWTKFGILSEYSSGIGASIRFGVQLPNASNESGLGIDEMNFFSSLLLQKHIAGRWTFNIGLGVLSDPTQLGQQHDVMVYALEYFIPIHALTSLLLQTAGRTGHDGIGVRRLANGKIGVEQSFGDINLKVFGVANFSPADNAKGIELSFSYLFNVIEVQNK